MTENNMLETRAVSSLVKVFADEDLNVAEWSHGSMLTNEVYSFQVAYRSEALVKQVDVRVQSDLAEWVTLRKVSLVPSEMPGYADQDDNVLRTSPGLYPDLLEPLDADKLTLVPGQWRSLWVTVEIKDKVAAGTYPIELIFETSQGAELSRNVFQLEVIAHELPKQTLVHTEWFHTDCLATWYDVEVFSKEYWTRVDQFLETAVKHGMNMILTPIFTPPLDTQVGGERPTVQLVDVEKAGKRYEFGFTRLKQWIDLCQDRDVEYFEFSHLFTQWGAKHAPKIMAEEAGVHKQIFGWDTDASGEEYRSFLDQFLPALVVFIKDNGLENCSYFHVSDEPHLDHLESYKSAGSILKKHLGDFPIIDALSNYEFYENGLVENPIPATNHIEPFLENQVSDLWTYYCCGQYKKVANRFFNMPSARNRILGVQLYKFNIVGFLQWGYNFYYSQYSRGAIDPFRVTDAGYAFPSGDAFIVYPGKEGPLDSLRLEVFYEALQDMRALMLLEEKMGKQAVVDMLEEGLAQPITFSEYPTEAQWLLEKREEINHKISELA